MYTDGSKKSIRHASSEGGVVAGGVDPAVSPRDELDDARGAGAGGAGGARAGTGGCRASRAGGGGRGACTGAGRTGGGRAGGGRAGGVWTRRRDAVREEAREEAQG